MKVTIKSWQLQTSDIGIFVKTASSQFAKCGCILRFTLINKTPSFIRFQWPHLITKDVHRPVVHEYVRCPDRGGREAEILDVAILGLIPSEVVVNPLLCINNWSIWIPEHHCEHRVWLSLGIRCGEWSKKLSIIPNKVRKEKQPIECHESRISFFFAVAMTSNKISSWSM